MEKMPYQTRFDAGLPTAPARLPASAGEWRGGLPQLVGALVTLRELRTSDASALYAALATEQVARFISPPPSTVEGFERFILWTHRQRATGQYVCYAIVPRGADEAIGLFQVRSLNPGFGTAEWGFALAEAYWGSGAFVDGATLMVSFAIDVLGVRRLEARAALRNGRGNGALRKLGARQEGVLRQSFLRDGRYLDQALWTILAEEWREAKAVWGPSIVH